MVPDRVHSICTVLCFSLLTSSALAQGSAQPAEPSLTGGESSPEQVFEETAPTGVPELISEVSDTTLTTEAAANTSVYSLGSRDYHGSMNNGSMWSNLFANRADDGQLWETYTAWEFKPGNDRVLGDGQLMVPLWQDDSSLIFVDIRGQSDDSENYEANWGLGVRTIRDDVIWGAYGFYDLRESENNNTFHQATLGVEAMSVEWEARFNCYLPETSPEQIAGAGAGGPPRAMLAGNQIVVITPGNAFETSLYGVDAEVGVLLADSDDGNTELRAFVGGFHFDNNNPGVGNVSGTRARLELRLYDLDMLREGSRLTLGGEVQYDNVRETQAFAMFRVRIPLGRGGQRHTRLQRRMLDRIVRDIDIVTQEAGGPDVTEAAINPATGMPFGDVAVVSGNDGSAALQTALDNNDTVIASNGADFTFMNDLELPAGTTLMGGGGTVMVQGATSGAMVPFNSPGTRPNIVFGNATDGVVLANDTTLQGLNIMGQPGNGDALVFGNNVTGVRLNDVNVTGTSVFGSRGVQFEGTSTAIINGGTIGDTRLGVRIQNNVSVGISIIGTTINSTGNGFASFGSGATTALFDGVTVISTSNAVNFSGQSGSSVNATVRNSDLTGATEILISGVTNSCLSIQDNILDGGAGTINLQNGAFNIVQGMPGSGAGGLDVLNGIPAGNVSTNNVTLNFNQPACPLPPLFP